jgi:hypothetical protein
MHGLCSLVTRQMVVSQVVVDFLNSSTARPLQWKRFIVVGIDVATQGFAVQHPGVRQGNQVHLNTQL